MNFPDFKYQRAGQGLRVSVPFFFPKDPGIICFRKEIHVSLLLPNLPLFTQQKPEFILSETFRP